MNLELFTSAGQPLTRNRAMSCVLINQFAAPGLGSLLGGRLITGTSQLLVTVVGFTMVVVWFVKLMIFYYSLAASLYGTAPDESFEGHWIGLFGAALFFLAWLWALFTSFSLLREARQRDRRTVPPPLTPPPLN